MYINNIHFIFLFRNPDERYVYAIFAGDKCVYVGVGVEYRCLMVYNVVRAKYVDLNGRGGKYRGEAQPNLR